MLAPVFGYVFELLGIENWNNNNNTIVSLMVGYQLVVFYLFSHGSANSYQKSFSRINFTTIAIVWMVNFLSFPDYENAVFSKVGLMSIGIQLGDLALKCLFLEHNSHSSQHKENEMDGTAEGIGSCFRMEVCAALIISAFGYPSFSEEDDITKYFCVIPFIAFQMIYFSSVRKLECSDSTAPIVYTNGSAVVVKEAPAEETILEADLKLQEVHENVIDEIATEEEVNEEKAKEEELPKEEIIADIANIVDTKEDIAEVAQETIGEIKDAGEEKVEEITDVTKEKLGGVKEDTTRIIEEDALFKRIHAATCNFYCGAQTQASKVSLPVLNVISKIISTITSLPWIAILLFVFSNTSHLLWSFAWLHLTGNSLSYLLPVFTVLIPLMLTKLDKIPPKTKYFTGEMNNLATALVQYFLITTEVVE